MKLSLLGMGCLIQSVVGITRIFMGFPFDFMCTLHIRLKIGTLFIFFAHIHYKELSHIVVITVNLYIVSELFIIYLTFC